MKKSYLTAVYLAILAAVTLSRAYQLLPKVFYNVTLFEKNINCNESVSLMADISLLLSHHGEGS